MPRISKEAFGECYGADFVGFAGLKPAWDGDGNPTPEYLRFCALMKLEAEGNVVFFSDGRKRREERARLPLAQGFDP